ncbi:MAG: hypothetical protein DRP89_04795 [Candidatus Neomarinimicrobiota bacterium]|nr:MAG: hypothetical protein DRP89_04795 [Candidatus Neomarinimicrobiota bacterium]
MISRNKVKWKYRVERCFLLLADKIFTPMPLEARHYIATVIGAVFYYFIPIRKKQVMENLKIAFPESSPEWRRKVAFRNFICFAKIFFDFFSVYTTSSDRFSKSIVCLNDKVIEKAIQHGKGAIIVIFHFGNWEALGEWFVRNRYNFGAIVRKLENPAAEKIVSETRRNHGMRLFSMKESSATILKFLGGNGILGDVADQDAGRRGIFIEYFDRLSSTFRGPAVFALRQKCPLIAGTCLLKKNGKYIIHFKDISTSIPEGIKKTPAEYLTQLYTNYFEKKIREYPEQYFWFHRLWKTKPPEDYKREVMQKSDGEEI